MNDKCKNETDPKGALGKGVEAEFDYKEWFYKLSTENESLKKEIEKLKTLVKSQAAYISSI